MDKNGFATHFFGQLMDEVAVCLKTRAVSCVYFLHANLQVAGSLLLV